MHLLVDSTGLRLCGPGEWLVEKHGTKTRRSWRKLHLGVDADTGRIAAVELTGHETDDGSRVGPLLDQVTSPVASFTADGAYDREDVSGAVAARHPEAAVVVPPGSSAVPSEAAETAPTQGSVRARASKYRLCWVEAGVWSSGFQEAQHRHGSPEEEQPAAIGGDMSVTAGAEAEKVAELIVASAEPAG